MRIIGYVEHPNLKITLFKLNNRLSVKFESGLYEQVYKIRESEQINNTESLQKIIDKEFIKAVEEDFVKMHQRIIGAIQKITPKSEDEFDTIL